MYLCEGRGQVAVRLVWFWFGSGSGKGVGLLSGPLCYVPAFGVTTVTF
jgi:hypothetical protein